MRSPAGLEEHCAGREHQEVRDYVLEDLCRCAEEERGTGSRTDCDEQRPAPEKGSLPRSSQREPSADPGQLATTATACVTFAGSRREPHGKQRREGDQRGNSSSGPYCSGKDSGPQEEGSLGIWRHDSLNPAQHRMLVPLKLQKR